MEIRSAIENLGPEFSKLALERLHKAIVTRLEASDPQIRFWAEEQVNLLQLMLVEMIRAGFMRANEAESYVVFEWQREELRKLQGTPTC